MQDETRSAVDIEPDFPAETFALPPEAVEPTLDAEAFAFGQQTHQVVDAFFHLGFFYGEAPMVIPSEIAPGETLLGGGGGNSIAVSYEQGLVVAEAPVSPKHGSDLVDALEERFPGVAITHVVQSHFHQDHASGVRSLVAEGATAVVGNGASGFWNGVLSAGSTIRPDALASASVVPEVEEVALNGTFVRTPGCQRHDHRAPRERESTRRRHAGHGS